MKKLCGQSVLKPYIELFKEMTIIDSEKRISPENAYKKYMELI